MHKRWKTIWRVRVRRWWYDYEWPVIGAIALTVVVLGCIGFRLHFLAEKKAADFVDLVFNSFQLFVLQISVEPPMPWQLNVARVLAPLVAAYTALQALGELFAGQIRSLRLRFRSGHVVVCGLGRKGLILARGFLERGQTVVVIEQDAENDLVRQCRDLGGVVLIGDAAEPWLLCRAGVARAHYLFATCGDDGVNAEIAVRASQLLGQRAGAPLTCVLHIFDPRLCTLLRERELEAGSAQRLRLEFFNIYDLGARVLLEEYPLEGAGGDGSLAAHRLVIVGVGRLGESLLVHAARQWHACASKARPKLQVTLVDQNAQEIAQKLLVRYPGLGRIAELTALDLDVHSAAFQHADFLAGTGPDTGPVRAFVCLDNDSLSLSAALSLLRRGGDWPPTIVVRMAQDAGLAVLLRDGDAGCGSFKRLRPFGLLDRTCDPDQVLRGTREILARAIHEEYLRQQSAAGVQVAVNSSMVPWGALPEHLRESNRQQADDIGAKLRAVHCGTAPLLEWDQPLFQFTPDEIERLARMEHERWMVAKAKAGWRLGPRKDNDARTHPCLVPFDQLPPGEQEKDRHSARQIPPMLAKVGFQVYRLKKQS